MNEFPPAPEPQRCGFLVVLRPEATHAAFLEDLKRNSPDAISWWKGAFRDDFPGTDPRRYAGWDRDPVGRAFSARELAAWPEQREDLIAGGADPECVPKTLDGPYTRAEHLMTERLGEDPTTYGLVHFVSPAVIPDLALAQEILAATDEPGSREIVHVSRVQEDLGKETEPAEADAVTTQPLGFDVGHWGGPFSLISDTMLYPRWHPGPEDALPVLREHATFLNAHMLFPTAEAAKVFRTWYRSQPWAESEWHDGAFCIVRIDRA